MLRGTFTALNTYICNHEKMTLSEKQNGGRVYSLTVPGEWQQKPKRKDTW